MRSLAPGRVMNARVRRDRHARSEPCSMKREDKGAGYRIVRLQELILEELRSLFRDDIEDPTLDGVRIVGLVLSADARHARVHYALVDVRQGDTRAPVERALVRATPLLRARIADAIDVKRVPELRFIFDAEQPEGEGA
jgi:ribosome-binding factor A